MALHTPSSAHGTALRSARESIRGGQVLLTDTQAAVEVEPIEPKDPALIATIKSMDDRGVKMMYGRWLIDGAPRVLLFDTGTGYRWLDEWKGDLWSSTGIPSPPGDSETNEAIVFGYLVAWFLGEVRLA